MDGAYFEPSINLNAGAVTLQYEYTPAATSTPLSVSSYTRAGNQHTIQFTGPAGQTAWALKGGSDLASFPNDHTANAVFTEPSSGNYQVVATLTGLPVSAYFFVISGP